MRAVTHKTVIGAIRDFVEQWMHRDHLSRQKAAMRIVEVHYRYEQHRLTGLEFQREGSDGYRVAQTNADRVFRWLDDVTKDTTLLPANFLRSILLALPPDLRARCAQELLDICGLSVSIQSSAMASDSLHILLLQVLKEGGEAHHAFAMLVGSAGDCLQKMRSARAELVEARAALDAAIDGIDAQLGATR